MKKKYIQWECMQRKSRPCKGAIRISLTLDDVRISLVHSHDGDHSSVEGEKLRCSIREKNKRIKRKNWLYTRHSHSRNSWACENIFGKSRIGEKKYLTSEARFTSKGAGIAERIACSWSTGSVQPQWGSAVEEWRGKLVLRSALHCVKGTSVPKRHGNFN